MSFRFASFMSLMTSLHHMKRLEGQAEGGLAGWESPSEQPYLEQKCLRTSTGPEA